MTYLDAIRTLNTKQPEITEHASVIPRNSEGDAMPLGDCYCAGAELALGIVLMNISSWMRQKFKGPQYPFSQEFAASALDYRESKRVLAISDFLKPGQMVKLYHNSNYYCFYLKAPGLELRVSWIVNEEEKEIVYKYV